jgi:hypothetical protein
MKSQTHTRNVRNHCRFICYSDARIIVGGEEAARRDQNAQMKSKSSRCVTTGDLRHTARAAESSVAKAQCMRPIRGKYSRASQRQRQLAANLTTFMTGVWRLMKAYASLWQKLYARCSEHIFDQDNRVPDSRGATYLDIRGHVSMQTGRLDQGPNRPIERSTRKSDFVHLSQARNAVVTCDNGTDILVTSPNQRGIQ